MPTGRNVKNGSTVIQNFGYSFNPQTRNLTWRKDNTRNIQENFGYDNLNRLTSFGGKTIKYAANGNVLDISSVGVFGYNSAKPYAIAEFTPHGTSQVPLRNQNITYNSLMRPTSITENNYATTFSYDYDGARTRMVQKKDSKDDLIRYYFNGGQYEIDRGVVGNKERLYIGGDSYSATAVYVKENNVWSINYICRDYLGSITHVTNASGALRQELSYDAWGRLRNPVNQSIYTSGSEPTLMLGRGYTGHEHLTVYGLINMNARLYDPILCRFLSPDPYVQNPFLSQNFNRYSYCLNNPLRYNDETGEIFSWIAGAVGGFIRGITRAIREGKVFDIFVYTWKGLANAVKIDWGLFQGNFKQIISRFITELPQTIGGRFYSQYRNIVGNVDKIRYFDGATYVINGSSKKNDGVTNGSFININISRRYTDTEFKTNGKFDPTVDPLFMHEYGHYIQSQTEGWNFYIKYGIPSIKSAAKSEPILVWDEFSKEWVKNSSGLKTHDVFWTEMRTNREAAEYFGRHYGVNWRYSGFPLVSPFSKVEGNKGYY